MILVVTYQPKKGRQFLASLLVILIVDFLLIINLYHKHVVSHFFDLLRAAQAG